MRRFSEDAVRRVGRLMFEAAGCSPADALTVVDHLVESCLFGHDSHGSLRVYEYIDQILAGTFDPKGIPRLERQKGVTACIDGDSALGQVAGRLAVETGVSLARTHGVGVVTVRISYNNFDSYRLGADSTCRNSSPNSSIIFDS